MKLSVVLLPFLMAVPLSVPVVAQQAAGATSPLELEHRQQQLDAAEEALRAKKLDVAVPQLKALLAADPKNARGQYDLGFGYEQLGQLDEAEAAYRAAIGTDAKQFEARFALGLLLARKNDMIGAREQMVAATGLSAQGGDFVKAAAWRALAQMDVTTRAEDAKRELAEAIKLSQETEDDKALEAQLAQPVVTPQATEDDLRKVLEAKPGDAVASAELAQRLVKENKPADAASVLEAAVAKNPADERLKQMLAHAYVQGEDFAKAAPLLEQLVAAHPDDAGLLDDYGSALVRLNRMPDAQKAFEAALARSGEDKQAAGAVAAHLAFAASANKDSETVLRSLAVRDAVVPPSAVSVFLSATAHDRLHHTKQAVLLYRQFLGLAGGKYPNEEWQAKHRLVALEHAK